MLRSSEYIGCAMLRCLLPQLFRMCFAKLMVCCHFFPEHKCAGFIHVEGAHTAVHYCTPVLRILTGPSFRIYVCFLFLFHFVSLVQWCRDDETSNSYTTHSPDTHKHLRRDNCSCKGDRRYHSGSAGSAPATEEAKVDLDKRVGKPWKIPAPQVPPGVRSQVFCISRPHWIACCLPGTSPVMVNLLLIPYTQLKR